MPELVSFSRDGEIGIVFVDNPPVNALSPGVPEGIIAAVETGQRDSSVRALVLVGAGRTFIAGADIREFEKIICGRRERGVGLHPLLHVLEDGPKPVVCAIHGTALGGGLEVAMACHYRIAVPGAQVGQPEVKLGLIPGAGGTQRLPRLAGVARALEMCLHGEPVSASNALEWGLIDRLADGQLLAAATAFAREISTLSLRKTSGMSDKLGDEQTNAPLFAAAREEARKRYRGRIAPLKAVDAIEAATHCDFESGVAREAELFMDCLHSDQARALIHLFFGEREVAKIPGIPKTVSAEIRNAAVVGAGTMGAGIAMAFANAGIPALLKEASKEALDRGMEQVRKSYEDTLRRGRITAADSNRRLALIQPVCDYGRFEAADVVVEAVFESLELKKQLFAELDSVCGPHAILATNTSSLDVDQIASATSRPQKVVGLHFFAPPQVMRLVEVVRGKSTALEVIGLAMALVRKLGKIGVLVGNARGFVGNRMYHQYQREAQFLVEEGAGVARVDAALYNFGMAMGPFATSDLSGLDVSWRIRKENIGARPQGRRQGLVGGRLCELGRFGRKTGAGWYRYHAGERQPIPDPDVDRIIADCVQEAGIPQRQISDSEIVERTMYALINEGAHVLEEGIALRAVDLDIIFVHGYGFPAHRGGPMCFADTVGLPKIYARILEFQREFGDHWFPAPLLCRLAESGGSFAGLDARGKG